MLTVAEFCSTYRISRGTFYNLLREGRAPRTCMIGRRRLISLPAADEWRQQLEKNANPTA